MGKGIMVEGHEAGKEDGHEAQCHLPISMTVDVSAPSSIHQ